MVTSLSGGVGTASRVISTEANHVVVAMPGEVWTADTYAGSVWRNGMGNRVELVLPSNMTSVNAMTARAAGDVWIVGNTGYVAHAQDTALTLEAAGGYSAPDLNAVWGTGTVVWVAGASGWLMRADGL
jgi:hypothetical protein